MKVIVGTRGSALATTQTNSVVELIRSRRPDLEVEIRTIRTEGDVRVDQPLAEIGGKGVFVKELESALERREIDLAVHSLKDVPARLADGLVLAAVLHRVDPRDVLVSREGAPLRDLRTSAVIGTGSQRREVQLRKYRSDLEVRHIRGNVDTRLRKLDQGQFDAIILAAAGLQRLGKTDRITEFIATDLMLPAVGQGVLAIETRADSPLLATLTELEDFETRIAITAERSFLGRLGAGCELPVGAYATVTGQTVTVDGMLARNDGAFTRTRVSGNIAAAKALGAQLAEELLEQMSEVRT